MNRLSPDELALLLLYCPDSGVIRWLPRPREAFASTRAFSIWNRRFANKPALTSPSGTGYLQGEIWGRSYKAHRVAFCLINGHWPCGEVDHINGIRNDNRAINLRDVTKQGNARNAALSSNNSTGVTGVYECEGGKKWKAAIRVDGRLIWLGTFTDKSVAVAARRAAEKVHGFHELHGRVK